MPRATTKRRPLKDAKGGVDDKALEVELSELDIQLDEWKNSLEAEMEDTLTALKRIVDVTIMKLPSRIRNMTVGTLLKDYGGHTSTVLQSEIKMNKLARTVAKPTLTAGARVATILKSHSTMSRVGAAQPQSVLGEESGADEAAPAAKLLRTASSTSVATGKPLQTPAAPKMRSVLGATNANSLQTPSISHLKSSIAAPTPKLNPLLPKTPAVRRPRRGEVLFAVSANGSPVGQVNVEKTVRASMAVKTGAANDEIVGAATEVQLDLGDGTVMADEESITKAVLEKGAETVFASIDAMEAELYAKLEAMKAAAAAAAASRGLPIPPTASKPSRLAAAR